MPEINQFGSGVPGDAQVCARCEGILMDALDHTASPEDQAFFEKHLASCVGCSRMFMDAQRGAAWLEMLRDPRPEPPAALLERILSQTTGTVSASATIPMPFPGTPSVVPATAPVPFAPTALNPARVIPFRPRGVAYSFGQRMLQPRLAMTAAMAFFSIALTLNLTGVHVTELRAGDLRPTNLRRNFYEANAHVVRYYDNLRVVYELEARVHDLQRTSEPEPDAAGSPSQPSPSAPKKQDDDAKPPRKPGPGSSLREPLLRDERDHWSTAAATIGTSYTPTGQLLVATAMQMKGDRS